MNDSRLNIVERPALFLTIKADNQRSAMRRQVQIIRDNIDNTIQGQPFGDGGWRIIDSERLTRPGIEDAPKFVDTNLPGSGLLQAASRRIEIFEGINIGRSRVSRFQGSCFLMFCEGNLSPTGKFHDPQNLARLTLRLDRYQIVLAQTQNSLRRWVWALDRLAGLVRFKHGYDARMSFPVPVPPA
jgi:hypothetical protein